MEITRASWAVQVRFFSRSKKSKGFFKGIVAIKTQGGNSVIKS
jgi:hypothetical protein